MCLTSITSELIPCEGWTQSGKCLWAMTQILISSPGLLDTAAQHHLPFQSALMNLHWFNKETVFLLRELVDEVSQEWKSATEQQQHLGGL